MDGAKTEQFKKKLKALKKEYEELIASLDQGLLDPMGETTAELSMYDNHPGDVASEVFERGKDIGFKLYAQGQIGKVEDALEKLEQGQYGVCDKCGQEIPEERLEIVPFTTMCVDCRSEDWDGNFSYNNKARRPIEEQVIMPPFGGVSNNTPQGKLGEGIDQNAFDGEDAWQAVARYGTSQTPNEIGALSYNSMYIDYDEDIGIVENYEQIPVYKDYDGQFYQDFDGIDDEEDPIAPVEKDEKSGTIKGNRIT